MIKNNVARLAAKEGELGEDPKKLLDGMIGTSYEKGLRALKSRVENQSPPASSLPRTSPKAERRRCKA